MSTATQVASLRVSSPAFENHQGIPRKYTCDGLNVNPTIKVGDVPRDAKSLMVNMVDPDAPGEAFTHWVIWNITLTDSIGENFFRGVEGKNNFGKIGYNGPCPPAGEEHRYVFKVYALDKWLNVLIGSDRKAVEQAMRGHILAEGELTGLYMRT